MAKIAGLKLLNGNFIPALGLGTYLSAPRDAKTAVTTAIQLGYKHIDCAAVYANEKEIGEAIVASKVPRESLFITSKLWNTEHHPDNVLSACEKTLKDLQLEYLDLYLIHWPIAFVPNESGSPFPKDANGQLAIDRSVKLVDTWHAMEVLVDQGKVKSIGLSNFTEKLMEEIWQDARIKPAVLQIEVHPYLQQTQLREYCKKKGIVVVAHSPLGAAKYPRLLDDPIIVEMAKRKGKTTAQILLSWSIHAGMAVIPKSVTPSRIKENMGICELDSEDMKLIENLQEVRRYCNPGFFEQVYSW